jgi:[ribosomal protein S18]-alanine N-acetyltransferase
LGKPRTADLHQAELLWPVVDTARLFASRAAYEQFVAEGRWRVRITEGGSAAVLDRWRHNMPILAVRGVWAPTAEIPVFVSDALDLGRQMGLDRVLSPLVSRDLLPAYEKAGMYVLEEIVAFRARPGDIHHAGLAEEFGVRRADPSDVPGIIDVDRHSFFPFWRYGEFEIDEALRDGRVVVVCDQQDLVAYSILTMSRGVAMLARIAVLPRYRGRGIAKALLSDVARYAERSSAVEVTLCTQATNAEACGLYRRAGLTEVTEPYVLAVTEG